MKRIILFSLIILGVFGYVFAQTPVTIEPGNNIISGKTTVSTANTATVLGSDTRVLSVSLAWDKNNNSNYIFIGTSSVSQNNGIMLTSGSILELKVNNLNKIYISSATANDSVGYVAVVR